MKDVIINNPGGINTTSTTYGVHYNVRINDVDIAHGWITATPKREINLERILRKIVEIAAKSYDVSTAKGSKWAGSVGLYYGDGSDRFCVVDFSAQGRQIKQVTILPADALTQRLNRKWAAMAAHAKVEEPAKVEEKPVKSSSLADHIKVVDCFSQMGIANNNSTPQGKDMTPRPSRKAVRKTA